MGSVAAKKRNGTVAPHVPAREAEIVARAGLDTVVRETTSDKFLRPAERPKYSVLSPESLQKRGIEMPGWQAALQRYLADRV